MLLSCPLRGWEAASLIAFLYAALAAAFLRPGVRRAVRFQAFGASMAGIAVTVASILAPVNAFLHGWLLPAVLLYLFYWTTGLLFVSPMTRVEDTFLRVDHALRIRALGARTPKWLVEILEFAYAGVYGLIPIALILRLWLSPTPDVDRFWTVILVTDFICFAALPWIQTRPPRALESGEPWSSSFRNFNLRWLATASIQVNTFPSGHAAEALAAALLVSNLRPVVFIWMLFNAAAVSAGAVFGRYHYAIDAFAGWFVAIAVWLWLMH
jgi:membrane-associated phospholipid phosphatase